MKQVSLLLTLAIAGAPAFGQTDATGTWRVDGAGRGFPWSLVLRVDGSAMSGMARSCASNRAVEIANGEAQNDSVTFTCSNPSGTHTLTFTGAVNGDELRLTWAKEVKAGEAPTAPDDAVFGEAAPRRLVARRVRDDALDEGERYLGAQVDQVRGAEFAAGSNLREQDVKIDGLLFIPRRAATVRAVIVAPAWGLGSAFYTDNQVRRLAETTSAAVLRATISHIQTSIEGTLDVNNDASNGGADALLALLRRFALESGHHELADAPLLFWGQSAAGPFGSSFAALHPERTIAFVRYHSGPVLAGDLKAISRIPALFFVGGKDQTVCPDGTRDCAQRLWMTGRAAGAPWTFALEPNAVHGSPADMAKASTLLVPWIRAVLQRRVPASGGPLRQVTADPGQSNWLPDPATARALEIVSADGAPPQ